MEFSEVLKSYREHLKLTQREIVARLRDTDDTHRSINIVSYHRWETGKVKPSIRKQASVLDKLGLDMCAKTLSLPEGKALRDYVERRYESQHYPIYAYGLGDNTIKSNTSELSESIPEFILDMQSRVFGVASPSEVIKKLLAKSISYRFSIYSNSNKQVLGHLLWFVLNKRDLEKDANIFLPNVRNIKILDINDKNIIFICCGFSATKRVFVKQISELIDYLYLNESIEHIYIRCYDNDLTRVLIKSTNCLVLVKREMWSGLLIESKNIKLLYAVINKPSCYFNKAQCNVEDCYGCKLSKYNK